MNAMLVKPLSRLILFIVACWLSALLHAASPERVERAAPSQTPRQTIVDAILVEDDEQKRAIITMLAGNGDGVITPLLTAWRSDALFIYAAPDGTKIPVQLVGPKGENDAQDALRVDTGKPLTDAAGKPLKLVGDRKSTRLNSSHVR